ncbi:hypothetical protein [Hoyosella altamirensis]|nr:hypothetical protein [Hoyosella altamirensis]
MSDADAQSDGPADGAEVPSPAAPRKRGGTTLLAIALAVMTGLSAVLGYLYWDATRDTSASEFEGEELTGAAAAGAEYAEMVSTYSFDNFDEHYDSVAAISTPEFQEEYRTAAESLREFLSEAEGVSEGTVEYAAVYRQTDDGAQVMVFLDQQVRNVLAPDGRLDKSRLLVTLHKVDGEWLLHDVGGS